jgi:hypothetical protein
MENKMENKVVEYFAYTNAIDIDMEKFNYMLELGVRDIGVVLDVEPSGNLVVRNLRTNRLRDLNPNNVITCAINCNGLDAVDYLISNRLARMRKVRGGGGGGGGVVC